MQIRKWNGLIGGALSLIIAGSPAFAAQGGVLAEKTKKINDKSYTFMKIDDGGVVRELVLDDKGKEVRHSIPNPKKDKIGKKLRTLLKNQKHGQANGVVKVKVALRELDTTEMNENEPDIELFSLTADNAEGDDLGYGVSEPSGMAAIAARVDGEYVPASGIETLDWDMEDRQLAKAEKVEQKRKTALKTLATRNGLQNNPNYQKALENARGTLVLDMDMQQVQGFLDNNDDLVAGVELYETPKDSIDDAMLATNVDPFVLNNTARQGDGITVYMTENGCPDAGHVTSYVRRSGPRTDHAENVSAIVREVSPDSVLLCRGGAQLPTWSDRWFFSPDILTRSNSSSCGTDYTTTDRDWDNYVYNYDVAAFNAAGNGCSSVVSPGKGHNIMAVGNYNDTNDTIHNSSNFVDPDIGTMKPEFSAPGTTIDAGGHIMTGTSQATPHAAGMAADFMGYYSLLEGNPTMTYAFMLASATDPIAGGEDRVGLGGLDYYSGHFNGHMHAYAGSNASSSFDNFDSKDATPNDGYIEDSMNIWSANFDLCRVAVSWLNRGTYTYDHRSDAHPIGMDLDISVYDPNGSYVGGSSSWDNSWEMVEFDPQMSGNYKVKVRQYKVRDSSLKFRMGIYWNCDW